MPLYYFTSELEIKPQLEPVILLICCNYFTSELEIKPQPICFLYFYGKYYFTSELEIKPQPIDSCVSIQGIILLPN